MLAEINKTDILNNFTTLKGFNKAISNSLPFLDIESSLLMQCIGVYYNNVFEFPTDMAADTINLYDLALYDITILRRLHEANPLFIFKFLYERMEANCVYVSDVRKLA